MSKHHASSFIEKWSTISREYRSPTTGKESPGESEEILGRAKMFHLGKDNGVRNPFAARGGPAPSFPTPTQSYTAIDQADLRRQNVPVSSPRAPDRPPLNPHSIRQR